MKQKILLLPTSTFWNRFVSSLPYVRVHRERFLLPYWKEGQRNRVEMAFFGWCLKRGVSLESALRIIDEVTRVTNDLERYSSLELVKYHYRNRRTIGAKLLGISGLGQIVKEAIQ
jgi:hypothetical protein